MYMCVRTFFEQSVLALVCGERKRRQNVGLNARRRYWNESKDWSKNFNHWLSKLSRRVQRKLGWTQDDIQTISVLHVVDDEQWTTGEAGGESSFLESSSDCMQLTVNSPIRSPASWRREWTVGRMKTRCKTSGHFCG